MADEQKPGYAFNYIADVGAGQQFQITGSFPMGVPKEQVDIEFKKFREVIEKHRTWSKIEDLRASVDKYERVLETFETTLAELDAAKKGNTIPNNERVAREQMVNGIKHNRAELEQARRILAERLKELE
jgi:hypothetical protein